mgnify:CR=1 FL=1
MNIEIYFFNILILRKLFTQNVEKNYFEKNCIKIVLFKNRKNALKTA